MTRWLDGAPAGGAAPVPDSGAGVFTTLRAADGAPTFLAAHLARLERDARALDLPWPPPWDVTEALRAALAGSPHGTHAVRIRWSPPHLALDARPVDDGARPWGALVDAPGRTPPPEPHGVKTTARGGYEHLLAEARACGAEEGLVVAARGALVEGTRTNVFLAVDDELVTPPPADGGLPGVMRAALLTELEREPLADARGRTLRARERTLDRADLARAEEVVLTNAVRLVVGLARLHGGVERALPGAHGPLAAALRARALRLAR